MSIALSVVVRPSFFLRLMLAGFSLLAIGSGVLLGGALAGNFSYPLAGAGISYGAGLILMYSLYQSGKTRRIDISDGGQIRLTVYQVMRDGDLRAGVGDETCSQEVSLMAGSTLWPGLLLLLLRAGDGRLTILPVWPDSVAVTQFRPLAVACRAISTRIDGQA